ncbi:type I polyketide synthase [Polyangium fumosum]|uniref:type I polyketide synthase n=1 Tax=Polyangium fumosum TaxID=889272 RepID=UPI0022B5FE80|nr:type I polyketide synthase [Polyangium fumosum]
MGKMASVALPEEAARAALEGMASRLAIAAVNDPGSVVLAGEASALSEVLERLQGQGVDCRMLRVNYAFHSPVMAPFEGALVQELGRVAVGRAARRMYSTVTGEQIKGEDLGAGYWGKNLREPVQFAQAIRSAVRDGDRVFVEVGPHPVLSSNLEQCLVASGESGQVVGSLRRERDEQRTMLLSLGALYAGGYPVEWQRHYPGGGQCVLLPTYPWQRQRYWIDGGRGTRRAEASGHPLLGERLPVAGAGAVFDSSLGVQTTPYLSDHRIFEQAVVPGTAFLELAHAAAAARGGPGQHRVKEMVLQTPMVLPEAGERRVQVVLSDGPEGLGVAIYSQPGAALAGDPWTEHVTGRVQPCLEEAEPPAIDLAAARARCREKQATEQLYAKWREAGLAYGPAFQGIVDLWCGEGEAISRLVLPAEAGDDADAYGIHPALLDAALQTLGAAMGALADGLVYLPFEIGGSTVWRPGATAAWVYARPTPGRSAGAEFLSGDVVVLDERGEVLAEVTGVRLKRAEAAALRHAEGGAPSGWLYSLAWQEVKAPDDTGLSAGTWLVLTAGSALGEALAASLRATGAHCVAVSLGADVTTSAAEALGPALDASGSALQGVVCLFGAERTLADATADRVSALTAAALTLVQALGTRRAASAPRLFWVTAGAQAVHASEAVAVAEAPLWGLGRAVMLEHPELGCTLIDLEPGAPDAIGSLRRELGAADGESQVAYRGGKRHAARLIKTPTRAGLGVPDATSYRLETAARGLLDKLCLVAAERQAPGAGEVEIRVTASGLNFRDVMNALGMYPGEAGPLGGECAGIVTAVGEGVSHLAAGDAVMALAPRAFSRFVTVDARLVARQPQGLSAEQAATVPIAFLTALYALRDLGGLRAGERVLIHAAAGGVGMAAVQVAAWAGAEVLATASPSKWDVVRAMGVRHVQSSRTRSFAEAFRAVTGGAGVDIVLNALTGELVDAGMELLASGGRFLEMGKTDLRSPSAVAAVHPGILYRAFDLLEAAPARIQELFGTILEGFAAGHLRPLPVRSFAITDAEAAFRLMAQARHIGKIALLPVGEAVASPIVAEGTVLITGGLGALGLHVARWLWEEHRVGHILLVGRRAPEGERLSAVEALRAAGARITVAQADVSDASAVRALLDAVPPEVPLRGVIHAAGVLDDGILTQQSPERFERVLAPKVRGAWNLHVETRALPLDFFVLFSSATSVLGSAGQSNYAAANAFLDGLAAQRRASGQPGLSVNWGAWAEGGMAEALDEVQRSRLARQGMGTILPKEGLRLLEQALSRPEAQLCVLPVDLRVLRQSLAGVVPPLWRSLLVQRPGRAPAAKGWAASLLGMAPEARLGEMAASVRAEIAKVLALGAPSDVPSERPLRELGLDSMMAVELRNALAARVGRTLPATLVFDHPTVEALARYLLGQLQPAESKSAAAPAAVSVSTEEPIAIVGIGCRYPGGVKDLDSFWRLLDEGVDAIGEVPKERWDIDAYYDPDPDAPGKMTTRWGGFLDGVDGFDPGFFEISPREAASIDPQQRLLLEVSWEALERAGQTPSRLLGSDTGVYMGICSNEYQTMALSQPEAIDAYSLLGTAHSTTVGRLSYWLGLKGPNVPVDTACSSSLVAVHLACQALRAGECSMALAGGVNLMLSPVATVYFSKVRAVSPTGRCHTFSADADGYVRGEGCGIVVLKRLSDAERDGDPILAVLRGTAVNQDGRSNGLTAPNGPSQEAVIRRALQQAGVAPAAVGYVEAHGTGTPLGDPIEVQALGAVLGEGRPADQPVVIGSVKSNFGHAEAAAGVAGLIKAVLALRHDRIPRSLHYTGPNPHIPWAELPVKVASESLPWPRNGAPRIAGVSSFGLSGTNAHVVVAEAPAPRTIVSAPSEGPSVLLLSAKTSEALAAQAGACASFLSGELTAGLDDIAYTASVRRAHHTHRLAVVGRGRDDLRTALEAFARGERAAGLVRGEARSGARPKLVFVYPGQGAQWLGMGRELFREEPVFRAAVEACDRAIAQESGVSVIEELHAAADRSRLAEIDVVQPVLFSMSVALSALWRAWGVEPDAVVGHSMGEIAAAHVAGAMSLESAASVVCRRSRLLKKLIGRGAMALVEMTVSEAAQAISPYDGRISIGGSNSARATVLSGEIAALEELMERLRGQGVFCRMVKGTVPSHGPRVDFLLPELRDVLRGVEAQAGAVPIYSTVTGEVNDGAMYGVDYWLRNLREPVLFAQAVERLLADGHALFVEMSPHPILTPAIEETMRRGERGGVALPSLRREQDEKRELLLSLGALYANGHAVEWERFYPSGGQCIPLPTYPFQRERYWLEEAAVAAPRASRAGAGHPLLGTSFTVVTQPGARFWERTLGIESSSYLTDHRVEDEVVLPGAAYVEMALAAAAEVHGEGAHAVEEISFERMLTLPQGSARTVQAVLTEQGPGRASFQVSSRDASDTAWVRHATASLRVGERVPDKALVHELPSAIQARCPAIVSAADHYQRMAGHRIGYGPEFQGVEQLWIGPDEVLGRVRLPDGAAREAASYRIHPALLDACFQVVSGLSPVRDGTTGEAAPYVPIGLARASLARRPGREMWVHARRRDGEGGPEGVFSGDIVLFDDDGQVFGEANGLRVQPLSPSALGRKAPQEKWLYALAWQRKDHGVAPPSPRTEPLPGAYLLWMDRRGTGAALSALLADLGERCIQVIAGERAARVREGLYEVDPSDPEGYRFVLRDAFSKEQPCRGVIHLWSLDAAETGATSAETLEKDQRLGIVSALHLAQAVLRAAWRDLPRLLLVTRGAQAVGAEAEVAIAQAPVWGFGRTLALEHPEMECTRLDLSPQPGADEATALLAELLSSDGEDQVALREEGRWVARLVRSSFQSDRGTGAARRLEPAKGRPFRLEISEPGVLERLTLQGIERRPPGPGQVEIEVDVASLNFIDVMKAMGIYPGQGDGAVALGSECAGRVVRVGEGVADAMVGQDVIALALEGASSHVTTDARFVVPRPSSIGIDEASAIPVVYLTAWYALRHVGRLSAGERVLIHSAAGGTGLAAIQIAKLLGAEIFATAGSPEKREMLRGMGIRHVMDSRTLSFAEEVLEATRGEGVDVVLNSLAGEAITKSMSVLAHDGRFLEIGKRDIYADRPMGLSHFRKALSYSAIDLGGLLNRKPALVSALLREVMAEIEAGRLATLPCQRFPASRVEEAFRLMARGQHVGKIVVDMRDPEARIATSMGAARSGIRADGSYLITGGLGGLGLSVAAWMVRAGARHLALLGRNGPSEAARAAISAMAEAGAEVRVLQADVALCADVDRSLAEIEQHMPPLRGVVHAAGILEDHTIVELSREHVRNVMGPKMQGVWNLHTRTSHRPLDFFVLYSSAASLVGAPGQANYAAANAFLDAFSHHRRTLGLPALSINWGPFSEVGLAAAQQNREQRLVNRGIKSLSPALGLEVLERLLAGEHAQIGVFDLDLRQWLEFYPSAAGMPLWSELQREGTRAQPGAGEALKFRQTLATSPPAERPALLGRLLAEEIGRVLRLPAAKIDPLAAFSTLGVDSLMSLELRNRLEVSLGIKLSAALLFTYPNITSLVDHLLDKMEFRAEANTSEPADVIGPVVEPLGGVDAGADAEELPDDALLAAFDESLNRIKTEKLR